MEEPNDSGFLQEFEKEMYLVPVSKGVRFGDYIIDYIIITVMIRGLELIEGYAKVNVWDFNEMSTSRYVIRVAIIQLLISLLVKFAYYAVFEAATRGRTIGKLIMGTIAIKVDGNPLTFKDALLRSLCRLIPFNAVSALFGRPWHDRITGTMVIKKP